MTFEKFHNALRIMRSIDYHEIIETGLSMSDSEWHRFMGNPYEWFIFAATNDAKRIWAIVERRNVS